MPVLTAAFSSFLFIATAHSLAPLPPNPALNVPLSSPAPDLTLFNFSSNGSGVQMVNPTDRPVICDAKYCGRDLSKASCEQVWMKIPRDFELINFGARTKGRFERPLPSRYLSGKFSSLDLDATILLYSYADFANVDDGLCAIDVNNNPQQDQDIATNYDISAAARLVLDSCVARDEQPKKRQSSGGYATYRGPCSSLLLQKRRFD